MTEAGWQGLRAYVRDTVSATRRDWPFYAILITYALVAFCATWLRDAEELFRPFLYLNKWLRPLYLLIPLILLIPAIASLRHDTPFKDFTARLYRTLSPEKTASLFLFLGLAMFHGIFTSLKNLTNILVDFQLDQQLADLDFWIHFGNDPWVFLPIWEPFTRFIQITYSLGWSLALAAMSFYAILYLPSKTRNQYLWTFFICWILLGNIVAIEAISAGPAYYTMIVGSDRFEPLMNYLYFSRYTLFSSAVLQEYLWDSYHSGTVDIGSGISAFPSLHLAMTTLWTLVAYRVNKWFGRLMFIFAILILIGSVHLGWHYAIDGYASILATLAIWKLVEVCQRIRNPSQQTVPAISHALGVRSAREVS